MNALRLRWIDGSWLLDVPAPLSNLALQRVIEWALPRQVDRFRSLPPGDKKDELKGAIEALQAGRVQQRVVGPRGDGKGDIPLFQAQRPDEARKIISVGR